MNTSPILSSCCDSKDAEKTKYEAHVSGDILNPMVE